MRIGHFAEGLNEPGGVRTYVLALAEAQRAAGEVVHLFDHADHRLDLGTPTGWDVQFVEGAEGLRRLCTELRVDVLHAHSALPPIWGAVWPRVPVVRTLHGHHAYCPSGSRFFARSGRPCPRAYSPLGCLAGHLLEHCGSMRPGALAGEFVRHQAEQAAVRCTPAIAISAFQRDALVRSGIPGDQLWTVHHPAWQALSAFAPFPRDNAVWLLFMGRLVAAKGAAWLLRATARARVPFGLAVAGQGPEAAPLERLARELGLADRVRMLGWCDPSVAAEWRARCRAVVVPSLWHEPAGLVAIEAAASGRAVIASRVGGLPEYLAEGRSGLLVPPGDEEALAQAMDALASDAGQAERLGRGGLALVQRHHTVADHLRAVRAVYARAA